MHVFPKYLVTGALLASAIAVSAPSSPLSASGSTDVVSFKPDVASVQVDFVVPDRSDETNAGVIAQTFSVSGFRAVDSVSLFVSEVAGPATSTTVGSVAANIIEGSPSGGFLPTSAANVGFGQATAVNFIEGQWVTVALEDPVVLTEGSYTLLFEAAWFETGQVPVDPCAA